MKTWQKITVIGLVAFVGSSTSMLAQNATATTPPPSNQGQDTQPDLYHAQEWSLDVFGTGTVGEHTLEHFNHHNVRHDGRLGLGVGANYFPCRYLGFGVDAFSESTSGNVVQDVSGEIIGRLPIGNTPLAPYAFIGGGRQFEDYYQWEGHVGIGLEVRFVQHVSFFLDARYVMTQTSPNYGLGRAGFRFSF
ncbi:MAG TPA: hypothetical protein VH619_06770 [Verrucomicrobiae bacterium]|jgi:hypothetical protein|nr:hypothetical protein [Verrucomicrobiae bacterium]